jgi:hypothetical protein
MRAKLPVTARWFVVTTVGTGNSTGPTRIPSKDGRHVSEVARTSTWAWLRLTDIWSC